MSKFAYNLYLDETGRFSEKGSAIVGFYIKYDCSNPEQRNFVDNLLIHVENYFKNLITEIKNNPPSEWPNDLKTQLENLNFYHCTQTVLTGYNRTRFQSYIVNQIRNYFSQLKETNLIMDFNIVVFYQELKYEAFRIKNYDLAIEVSRSRTYLDMLAEGLIKFWLDKKTNEPDTNINIYISARSTAKNLGITSIEDYVKSIITNAGRLLNDKQKSSLYSDLLDYYVDNNQKLDKLKPFVTNLLNTFTSKLSEEEFKRLSKEIYYPNDSSFIDKYIGMEDKEKLIKLLDVSDYKKFSELDFHNYLYEPQNVPQEYKIIANTPYHGNLTTYGARKWKFKKINILHNIKNLDFDFPNTLTTICDYFANTYFHIQLNSNLDESTKGAYLLAFGNSYLSYATLTNSLDMFVTYQQQLLDKNLFEIIKKIIVDPNIIQSKYNHHENYIASYYMNIDKYSGILCKTLSIFDSLSDFSKRRLFDQIKDELIEQVKFNDKKLKNYLAVTYLITYFNDFFAKDEWFRRYLIDFNLFLLKIHLDFNELTKAEALYHKINESIVSNTTLSPNDKETYQDILIVSMLNYYSDTFNYNALQNLYSTIVHPRNILSQQKAKATNILLNTKIKKIKQNLFNRDELMDEINELVQYAIKNFSTALPIEKARTYQIYSQLAALLSSETSVPALYNAAGITDLAIDKLYATIFKGSYVNDKQKYLYITFLEVLTHVDSFRNEYFNKEYLIKGINNQESYPDCIIYWKLATLAKKLAERGENLCEYCNTKLRNYIDKQPGGSLQEKFLKTALLSLKNTKHPTLIAIKVAITADYILATNIDRDIHLNTLKQSIKQLQSFKFMVCPFDENLISELSTIKSTSDRLDILLKKIRDSIHF